MTKTKEYVYGYGVNVPEVWQNIGLLNLIFIAYIWLICQWAGDNWKSDKDYIIYRLGICSIKLIFLAYFSKITNFVVILKMFT